MGEAMDYRKSYPFPHYRAMSSCPDLIPVTRFMLFEQAVADQQLDTTLADLDRRDHDHTPGAALAEASCTGGGCWFVVRDP